MGVYEDKILPRMIDWALSTPDCNRWRQRATEGLAGRVLEVGFGSGLNLPYLPQGVRTLLAVDPAMLGRKLAASRLSETHCDVQFVGLDGERLPVESESVDAVLSTWTLCTIPDVHAALREIARILRPGGQLHFLEHGLSPRGGVARAQRLLTPVQKRIAGGCHLDRDIPTLLREAGFHLDSLTRFNLHKTPEIVGAMVHGRARIVGDQSE